ncbi:SDR family NAD(P)-dependent oxidoreductase [Fluviispira multicolorata]|uniref:SDR family NAD(P)-dependent oxidoreductase n=1 Tax=Fluviispira multicolorata TaxID=2654512 RepID=A0A833JGK9_9BACT|nr:SDR family NAD(P)-dependent oxidoreductase [Fluviispira multicolorata]KAB8032186.1 SDR family NAD(P)-dependent oxidoreductase [Fluviispira multicolorata]
MKRFINKNILVTGAASGIGKATALRIASEGGNLALLDNHADNLITLVEDLKKFDVKIVYSQCDVSEFEQTKICIDKLCNTLGGVQGLSHNAGILRSYKTHEMQLSQWNELIAVNLTGTFNVNRHALPWLLKNETSYLVNTSSSACEQPHPWLAAYAATKGAIKSFTRSLFVEYFQQGLHANCILPGAIITDLGNSFDIPKGVNPELIKTLNPLGNKLYAEPSKAAGVTAMLLSDEAFHINGTEISIDGGKV